MHSTGWVSAAMGVVLIAGLTGCSGSLQTGNSSPSENDSGVAPSLASNAAASTAAALTAAQETSACQASHGLRTSGERITADGAQTTFDYCVWPPVPGAGQDGFLEIDATEGGTGLPEASDASSYDVISGPCTEFTLGYSFGSMGAHTIEPTFEVTQGTVTSEDHPGQPFDITPIAYSSVPYPDRGEVVYLRNSNQVVDSAYCTR